MTDLIARLEAAAEGSRELDAAIHKLVRTPEMTRVIVHVEPHDYEFHDETAQHYTTSIDAALTLVPEGLAWHVSGPDPVNSKSSYAVVVGDERVMAAETHYEPAEWGRDTWEAKAATPALALCIAALKARSA